MPKTPTEIRLELETLELKALAASLVYLAAGLTLNAAHIWGIASLWFREAAKLAAVGCACDIAIKKFVEHGY